MASSIQATATSGIPSTRDSVTAYLGVEHHRLDGLLADLEQAVRENRLDDARTAWPPFESGLDRHIRIEEELLFPVFELTSGVGAGSTALLRIEHQEIRRALGSMRLALVRGDKRGFQEARAFMATVRPGHDAREEHIVCPAMDHLLGPAERAILLSRLSRLRDE